MFINIFVSTCLFIKFISSYLLSQVDIAGERCLVNFMDNTSSWSSIKELKKISSEPKVTCVLCKNSQSKTDNNILACDKCGRGYHQLCHQVNYSSSKFNSSKLNSSK